MSREGLISSDSSFGRFLSIAPVVSAFLLLLSPSRSVHEIYKKKSTMALSVVPYLCLLLSTLNWGIYGVLFKDLTLIVPNVFGIIMGFTYTAVYHRYAAKKQIRALYGSYLFLVLFYVILGVVLGIFETVQIEIMSAIALTTYVAFLVSPFATLYTVLKTKSVDSLPFDLSMMLFLNSFLWALYGLLVILDPVLYYPNIFGTVISALQLLCHVCYGDFLGSTKLLFCGCFGTAATKEVNHASKDHAPGKDSSAEVPLAEPDVESQKKENGTASETSEETGGAQAVDSTNSFAKESQTQKMTYA